MIRMLLLALPFALLTAAPLAAHPHGPGKDRTCLLECRHEYRACVAPAYATARLCVAGCAELVETARRLCATEPDGTECAAAREEANACLSPCRQELRAAVRSCLGEARACREACPDRDPIASKDPACVGSCHLELRLCRAESRSSADECADECVPLVEAARAACTDELHSEDCRLARAAAHECMRPCRQQRADANLECVRTARDCVASCPEVDPDTTTTERGPLRHRPRHR